MALKPLLIVSVDEQMNVEVAYPKDLPKEVFTLLIGNVLAQASVEGISGTDIYKEYLAACNSVPKVTKSTPPVIIRGGEG